MRWLSPGVRTASHFLACCIVMTLLVACATTRTHRGYLVENSDVSDIYWGVPIVGPPDDAGRYITEGFRQPIKALIRTSKGEGIAMVFDCDPDGAPYFYLDTNMDQRLEDESALYWSVDLEKQDRWARVQIRPQPSAAAVPNDREVFHVSLRYSPELLKASQCGSKPGPAPLLAGQMNTRQGRMDLNGRPYRIGLMTAGNRYRYRMDQEFNFFIDMNRDGLFELDLWGGSDETYTVSQNPTDDRRLAVEGILLEIAGVEPMGEWVELREISGPAVPKNVFRIGDQAPEFTIVDWKGLPVRFVPTVGGSTWILFWQSGCKAYEVNMPEYKRLYQAYHDKGFQMLSLNCDAADYDLASFIQAHDIPWPNARIDAQEPSGPYQRFKIRETPYAYLIGPDGRILLKNPTVSELRQALIKLYGRAE